MPQTQISVKRLFDETHEKLGLTWVAGLGGGTRLLAGEIIQKPTLALIGHLNFVHPNRVQVLGCAEMDYLRSLDQGALTEFSTALPHHKSRKARFIAVASAQRSPLAPDVTTMIEGGVKDFTGGSYVGILAPAGTPADVVVRLQAALARALASDKVQDRMRDLGAEMASADTMTAAGFAAFIRAEYERMRLAAQVAGLKKE